MIIINCDDFALNDTTSEAILICGEAKKISSTTLMATKTILEKDISRLNQIEGISTGIHLDFDHFIIFDALKVYGTHQGDRDERIYPLKQNLKKMIIEETHQQITTLLKAGISISHFDSHHNVHLFPEISPLVMPIFKEYNITKCRFNTSFFTEDNEKNNFLERCEKYNITHPIDCFDFNEDSLMLEDLSRSNSFFEIMCHIDTDDNFMNKKNNYNKLLSMEKLEIESFHDLPS